MSSWLKRAAPVISARITAPVQRFPISSMARWKGAL